MIAEPFQPVLAALADLERDDPKVAFRAARLVGLYRRLWGSCVSKHLDGEELEQDNQIFRDASMGLCNERDGLQLRHDEQLSRLRFLEQALGSSRERLTGIINDWNQCSRSKLAASSDIERAE